MRKVAAAAGVGIFTLLATPWVTSAAAAPITVVGGTAFELPSNAAVKQTITVPVVVAARTANLVPRVVDVTEGRLRRPAQLAAVTSTYSKQGPSILLTIAANQLLDAATYTVDIRATSTGNQPQIITITLTRPAAVLDAVPTVTSSRTRSYVRWMHDSVQDGTVTFAETSGRTTLRDLTFEQTQDLPGGGRIVIDTSEHPTIDAGGHATYLVRTSGHFGLGSTTVTMRLRSPQLAAPVTFTVDVTQRVSRGWLVGVAVIGAFVAWLLNDRVVVMIARGRAKRTAADLKDTMTGLLVKYPDPGLHAAVSAQLTTIDNALDHHIATLPTVVDDVQRALGQAQQAYEQSRVAAAALVDTLRADLAATTAQFEPIRDILTTLQREVTDAEHSLEAGSPTVALKMLATARTAATSDLAVAVTAWRAGVRADVDRLAGDPGVPARLQVAAGILLGRLDSAPLDEPKIATAAAVLAAVDVVRDRLVDTLEPVRRWRADALAATTVLRDHSAVGAAQIDALAAAADALPAGLELADVEKTLAAVVATVPDLQQAAYTAMVTPLAAVRPAAARHQVEGRVVAQLGAGYYDGAAHLVAAALPRPAAEISAPVGRPGSRRDLLGLVAADLTRRRPVRTVAASPSPTGLVMDVWRSTTVLRIRGGLDIGASRLLQALLTAVVAVVLVVSLFGADWTGDWSDIAKVFFWGFTVNLSTGALTKVASVVGAPPGAAAT